MGTIAEATAVLVNDAERFVADNAGLCHAALARDWVTDEVRAAVAHFLAPEDGEVGYALTPWVRADVEETGRALGVVVAAVGVESATEAVIW